MLNGDFGIPAKLGKKKQAVILYEEQKRDD